MFDDIKGVPALFDCPTCSGPLETLIGGGCGGRGSVLGCRSCESVFEQTTGGLLPTMGGERYRTLPNKKFSDYAS